MSLEEKTGSLEETIGLGKRAGVEVSDADIVPKNPKIDELAKEGLSLRVMEREVGSSYETIRQYLISTKQHDTWLKLRRNQKTKKQLLEELISSLQTRAYSLVQKEGWASQKAFQYTQAVSLTRLPYTTFVALFKKYEEAKNSGKKLSLKSLGNGLGLHSTTVWDILSKVGVEPLYGNSNKCKIPKEKKEAIKRGFNLEMSNADIAYFIGISGTEVSETFVSETFRSIGTRPKLRLYRKQFNKRHLTYRLLSQIYEAQDVNFGEEEIAQLLNINNKFVNYAIANRQFYKPRIVSNLRTLLADKSINKPYLRI